MRLKTLPGTLFAAALTVAVTLPLRADSTNAGLWVGEVVLDKVNETVTGVNSQNQFTSPDPLVPTPVKSAAHLRIIIHVDAAGQARLLKHVAVLDKSTNGTPDIALVTDESLYGNFPNPGKRISAAGYDFGDTTANSLLKLIASSAAAGAVTNGTSATNAANAIVAKANIENIYDTFAGSAGLRNAALNAALSARLGAEQAKGTNGNAAQVLAAATGAAAANFFVGTNRTYAQTLQSASLFGDTRFVPAVDGIVAAAGSAAASSASSNLTSAVIGANATNAALVALTNAINAPGIVSGGYTTFLATGSFQSAAGLAAAAATTGANNARTSGLLGSAISDAAQAAALKALTDASVFKTAARIVDSELPLSGNLGPSGSLGGTIFLGADHPTNPFMHRRHPDHSTGYDITRLVAIQFYDVGSTNAQLSPGFGVDRLAGTYREEVFGLHKPLGPNQDHGLITTGFISLSRVSPVSVLNQ